MFGTILSGGINVFGIPFDPALFCFLLAAILFGGMNLLEYKRFD